MAKTEVTSKKLAALAARVVKDPKSASLADVKALAACVLTQTADRPKAVKLPARPVRRKPAPAIDPVAPVAAV